MNKVVETFGENETELLLERAKLEFRNGLDKEALLDFISVYDITGEQEIYDLILQAYYFPNEKRLQDIYWGNTERLKKYLHYRNEYEPNEAGIAPIWQDEGELVCVNLEEREFVRYPRHLKEVAEEKNRIPLVINELWMDDILILEKNYQSSVVLMDLKIPLYLVYDRKCWDVITQLYNFEGLLEKNRVVFLVGTNSLYTYLREDMAMVPNIIFYNGYQNFYKPLLDQILKEVYEEARINTEIVQNYYKSNAKDILVNIKKWKKTRILFLTSRFTTALQYHTRDCIQAAVRCGCEVKLLIEKDNIHFTCEKDVIKCLASFRPDIVFSIDHFRSSRPYVPKEVVWITWIQDFLPQSTGNKEKIEQLGIRDIMASMFISDLTGRQWGMNYKEVLKFPITANTLIYKNRNLSVEEQRLYQCDICIVANASDYQGEIECFLMELPEMIRADCKDVLDIYIDLMEQEQFFYGKENNFNLIKHIISELGIPWSDKLLHLISENLYNNIFYRRYKTLVAEWLVDNGYTNIRLYGNEWDRNEKLKPYAMGVAENGEVLSKILGASKIAIGLHPHVSLPARAIESIASGALYIAHDIPVEFDLANAREYFREGEEIIYYYDRQDLLKKIDYYLKNEDERKRLVKAGQKRIAEDLDYEVILKRVILEAVDLIEKREG